MEIMPVDYGISPNLAVIIESLLDGVVRHHVLAGWYGSYLGSESWRLSTPIMEVISNDDDVVLCTTSSGSTYILNRSKLGLTSMTNTILAGLVEIDESNVKVIVDTPEDVDDWIMKFNEYKLDKS